MFPKRDLIPLPFRRLSVLVLMGAMLAASILPAAAQQQSQPPAQSGQENSAPGSGPQDVSPIAVPHKGEKKPAEEKKPEKFKNPAGMPDFSVRVDVPSVNVDVIVTTKNGIFVPGLRKENFRILEDGVPQQVTTFNQTEAPITVVLLTEFAANNYALLNDMLTASYTFAQTLKPNDYVAVISYDMKPQIQLDFTQDKQQLYAALGHMRVPGFSETNLFDALYDTLDRIDRIEGRKYVVLVASGIDTFSKHTLDDAYKKVKNTPNVTIYAVSTGGALRTYYENNNAMGAVTSIGFLQADNQMSHFASMTGGMYFKPRFPAEFRDVFNAIGNTIRNEYLLSYHPSNTALDGKYRKIKIELVNPVTGGPLIMRDEKGKDVKYLIIARDGYTAKHVVE